MQLYYIIPVPSGPVDPGYGVPGPPPGIWPSPGHPAHPIAPGGPPPGTWGGSGQPFPGWGLPGQPPGFWGGSSEPFPGYGLPGGPGGGGKPPGFWGGSSEPFPGYGLPGGPGGGKPPGFWGGSSEGHPTPPIVIPNPPGPGDKPPDLPPGAPVAPQNPTVATPGSMQPPAPIPGSGSVWLLGYFGAELGMRWVAVEAGGSVAEQPPAKPQHTGQSGQAPKR